MPPKSWLRAVLPALASCSLVSQADGYSVIATSRNLSRTPELVAEIEGKGGQWSQLSMNSTNSAQVIKVLEKSGHEIDVLADNAGYCIYAHLDTFAKGKIRVEMESMSFGPLCLIRGVLPHMRRRWFDIIVKMSSGAALEARDNAGAKCTWAILSRFDQGACERGGSKSSGFFPSAPIWRQA